MTHKTTQRVVLDSFDDACTKLEFDTIRQRIVRYGASDPGRELLQALSISTSLEDICEELSRVTEVKRLIEQEDSFPLDGIHQVRGAIQKASVEGTILSGRELFQIASTARAARTARSFLARRTAAYPLIWLICEPLFVDKVLEFNIDQAIDETGAIRANASKELQSIRRAINDRFAQLKKRLESILKNVSDLGFSQEDIITTREGRMVIPVKTEHKNRVHGFIHSASASGATVFIEPTETLELNNELRGLQFQEQREIERILKTLTEQVGKVRDALLMNIEILARVDALHAKATYSIEILGAQPVVDTSAPIKLVHARHPILMMNHGYEKTVPLDLELGGRYTTLVITGPNAGGKSVAMKCVGLLVLMVQAGLHIPAAPQSVVRIFEHVFVDIGDEQSIENDLSTFSSHLKNLKSIDEQANGASLVLIDEIGSGTDPAEGGAIAAAVLESLTHRGAFTVATTHHSALKVFAYETERVENGAMEFDQTSLTPTYRFRSGIPGSSYALEMAGRLGFEESLLRRSYDLLGKQSSRLENLIAELESSAQQQKREFELVQKEKATLSDLVSKYESKIAIQAAELKETKRRALVEAQEIVDNANAVIERSIREIRETSAEQATTRHVRQEVEKLRRDIVTKQKDIEPEDSRLPELTVDVGTAVRLKGGMEIGEIESVSADGKSAIVIFGSLRMKAATVDLLPTEKRQGAYARQVFGDLEKPKVILQDLDLRGMTGEEAIPMVDKFIDDAILAGLYRVDLIHGKGTGALRKRITEYLAHHPRVKSFRLGEWNEGGTGATVVDLVES